MHRPDRVVEGDGRATCFTDGSPGTSATDSTLGTIEALRVGDNSLSETSGPGQGARRRVVRFSLGSRRGRPGSALRGRGGW